MKVAYIEPFSGASGDMILGALLDAGVVLHELVAELAKLRLPELTITATPVSQHGLSGTFAVVAPEVGHNSRSWRDIRLLISDSDLSTADQTTALLIFANLAEAEATVHGVAVDEVHFHEVGALDTIVDIVGAVVGLRLLGIERLYSAPLHLGGGTVRAAHGVMPVPAPATARLLAQTGSKVAVPMVGEETAGELLTPTGAAIIGTLADFSRPEFRVSGVGVGFGSREYAWPNMCRLMIGDLTDQHVDASTSESLVVLDTNIDDMNPQFFEILVERLFTSGALDVWTTPISMKKGRSAQQLSVLARPIDRNGLIAEMIEHSTTLGVRASSIERFAADRRFESILTKWGDVRIKLKIWNGRVLDIAPEYDDCAALARAHDVGVREIWTEAYRIGGVYVGRRSDPELKLTVVDPIGRID